MIEVYDISWMNTEKSAVALGYFDSIHIAHQSLIGQMKEYADKNGLQSAIFTFTKKVKLNHKGSDIYTQKQKIDIVRDMGVQLFYSPDFSQFSEESPREFVEKILVRSMGAKAVFCGENFFFGKNRRGNVEVLRELCGEYGIDFHKVETVYLQDEYVSSTLIREHLSAGEIEKANRLLGRPYSVELPVRHGKRNGHLMGTPTINQVFPASMCTPKEGVYISATVVDGIRYPSATGFGNRPTVNGTSPTCETYILGFEGDLYDREVKVEFYSYLFPVRKFDSLEELGKMIRDAREASERYLEENGVSIA